MRKAVSALLAMLILVSPALAATVVVPGLPPVVVPDPPYSGAVLHLTFDEGSGNVTYNAVNPLQNNGTIYGAQWVPGKLGYALQFDGVDDYILINDFSVSDPQGEITVSAWVKPIDEAFYLINRRSGNSDSINTAWRSWTVRYSDIDERFVFYITLWDKSANGIVYGLSQPVGGAPVGKWYHVAMTWSNATNEFKAYVNGQLVASTQTIYPYIYYDYDDPNATAEDKRLFIGDFDGVTSPGKKIIDEVMIFNRALSDEEIQLLYQRGASHRFDTNISLNLRQISVPRLDLGRSTTADVSFDVSADATNVWIPVPASATDLSTTNFAYSIDGKVLTIDDNRYVNASSVSFRIPIRIDSATKSELPGELYLDSDSKTFEFKKSVRIYNPSDISIMASLSIDPSAIGIANAYLDGSPMSLYNGSLISSLMLSPGESKIMELTASLLISKQELEFRSTLDDFLEINSFDQAYRMAQSAAEGKIDTMTKVIAIETLDFKSFGNRSIIIPLDVKAKDVIEAKALTGSKELLEIREGKNGKAEIVVPATAFNGTAFDMQHAEIKVIYNKKPAWWEGIPFLKSLGGFFEFLKKLFGGG